MRSNNFNSTLTGSEMFTPGSTTLSLAYTPGWTGSFNTTLNPLGTLSSQFVYNIGPISGSDTILNASVSSPGVSQNLSGALNSGTGVSSSQTGNGPGLSAGLTLSAQAGLCPFCATVASATIGINIGSQLTQTVSASPTVTYGDLVWYSTTATYSASDTFTFETGSGGNVLNTFELPGLSLTSGEDFYMNILPVVELTMPVTNTSELDVPASIYASWDVFGSGGSTSWPLGNLFSLSTGAQTFSFNADFYGSEFYSVPLEYGGDPCFPIAVCPSYEVPTGTSAPGTNNGGPSNNLPGTPVITCLIVGECPPAPGGYGNTNNGPLFPGDPSGNDICAPSGGDCITSVTTSFSSTPEPTPGLLLGLGLILLAASRTLVRRRVGKM